MLIWKTSETLEFGIKNIENLKIGETGVIVRGNTENFIGDIIFRTFDRIVGLNNNDICWDINKLEDYCVKNMMVKLCDIYLEFKY
jgi:hypothetical protein